jgi:pimeloyl-ACP methyl ester carboxylesterase
VHLGSRDAPQPAANDRVLVIPGLDGDASMVRAVAPRLFAGMRVLAFDHRFDKMDGGVEGLAERALAVLDSDGDADAPALVCGESFGGTAALTLAHLHPPRVRGLILLSAFGRYPKTLAGLPRLPLSLWTFVGDRWARRLLGVWRPLSLPAALGWGCSSELVRAYLRRPAIHVAAYRAKCEIALHFDARPWLAGIRCPTFILIGSWDPFVPTRAGLELAERLPNARLHQLTGGHLTHVAHATAAGELITDWVTSIPTPAGPG